MRTIKRLRLKELREEHGIAQGDIASKAGISQAFLSAVESGRRPASDKLKQVLVDQFNIDNIEDYEIEVETDDVKGYTFANNGQYNDGQSGGQANYYDMKGQPQTQITPTADATTSESISTTPLEVMTSVVKDYLERNNVLQQDKKQLEIENEQLKKRIRDALEKIETLENDVKRLKSKLSKIKNK